MKQAVIHPEGAVARAVAGNQTRLQPAVIKLGLDIHAKTYVVVAQYDHAALRPPRRFGPVEFVPWVEELLAAGHTVHVVYRRVALALGCAARWRRRGRAVM